MNADLLHAGREALAQPVILHLADKGARSSERGYARQCVGGGTARNLLRLRQEPIEPLGVKFIDQGHDALRDVMC